jgi:hypothetical protein
MYGAVDAHLSVQLGRNMAANVNHLGFLGFIVHGFTQVEWKAKEP